MLLLRELIDAMENARVTIILKKNNAHVRIIDIMIIAAVNYILKKNNVSYGK